MKHRHVSRKIIFLLLIILFLLGTFIVYARMNGMTGKTTLGSGQGCSCHGSSSANVTVTISGPDSLNIGETGSYEITITGGPLVKGGTNIASSDGMLNIVNSELKKDTTNGDLTHTSPKDSVGGEVKFQFDYTAPVLAGDITLAALGNSVNDNVASSGDEWNFAPDKIVTVVLPASIAGSENSQPAGFSLSQNYPNPFNPETRIDFEITKSSNVILDIYNSRGQLVNELVNNELTAGKYNMVWTGRDNAGNLLSSGVYFYSLRTGKNQELKRMLLLK